MRMLVDICPSLDGHAYVQKFPFLEGIPNGAHSASIAVGQQSGREGGV